MCGFAMSQEPQAERRIAKESQIFCVTDKDINKSSATAMHFANGRSDFVICTTTGKILRYVES